MFSKKIVKKTEVRVTSIVVSGMSLLRRCEGSLGRQRVGELTQGIRIQWIGGVGLLSNNHRAMVGQMVG